MNYYYAYESKKLAENEADWMLYFRSLARHYVRAFSKNFGKLDDWSKKLKAQQLNADDNYETIKAQLTAYYQLFMALSPDPHGNLTLNKEILRGFYKVTDPKKIKLNRDVYNLLALEPYVLMGEKFTLHELMNITLNFYHDREFRESFFKNIITSPKEIVEAMTLSQMLPQNVINNFHTGQIQKNQA